MMRARSSRGWVAVSCILLGGTSRPAASSDTGGHKPSSGDAGAADGALCGRGLPSCREGLFCVPAGFGTDDTQGRCVAFQDICASAGCEECNMLTAFPMQVSCVR